MDRIQIILRSDEFLLHLKKIKRHEKGRKFCKHNLAHLLDVARIAYILNLEENLSVQKPLVYAAALLHDIGRWVQYENKTPHELASAELAVPIMQDVGFSQSEIDAVTAAILSHRDAPVRTQKNLAGILYRADKLSRNCITCKASTDCHWAHKNKELLL